MPEAPNADLESFRQQWRAEVSSRRQQGSRSDVNGGPSTAPAQGTAGPSATQEKAPHLQAAATRDGYHEGWLDGGSYNFDDLDAREDARKLGTSGTGIHPESKKEPQTALEHFERAVEKEGQGNMQESLIHYRRAYKLDDQVDRVYRNKHFPPNVFPPKATNTNPSSKSVTVPNTAHHSLHGSQPTLSQLFASFAGVPIQPVVPEVEGDPQKPCPIASVPHEILVGILDELALLDVAAMMRTSRVCKHLAYVTRAEEAIWRRVCFDSKFGFADMKRDFTVTHKWQDLPQSLEASFDDLKIAEDDQTEPMVPELQPTLTLTPAYPSFLETFRARPRIRFTGVYISTVNYVRSGMTTSNSVYWGNSPVHMVTYYRYLRFFRDGSAISLLTFFEPHDVVPLLRKDNLLAARKKSKDPLPSSLAAAHALAQASNAQGQPVQPPTAMAVMREARKARWRMNPLQSGVNAMESDKTNLEPEGNVYVELEGPTSAYTYHMQLGLRSVKVGGVAKNTKLAWQSFWSHNSITDDWGEFTLKNDRAYAFSRVKSWADA